MTQENPWAFIITDELNVIELGIRVVMAGWDILNSPVITIYHRELASQDWDEWLATLPADASAA